MAVAQVKPDGTGDFLTVIAWDVANVFQDAECFGNGGTVGTLVVANGSNLPGTKIFSAAGHRHSGTFISEDVARFLLNGAGSFQVLTQKDIDVIGMKIIRTGAHSVAEISLLKTDAGGTNSVWDGNLLEVDCQNTGGDIVPLFDFNASARVMINNIIGVSAATTLSGNGRLFYNRGTGGGPQTEVSHNTVMDLSGAFAEGFRNDQIITNAFNNIVIGSTGGQDFDASGTITNGDANVSGDASAVAAKWDDGASVGSVTGADTFEAVATDLNLKAGSAARGIAIDRTAIAGLEFDAILQARTDPGDAGALVASIIAAAGRARLRGRLRRSSYHGHHHRN